MSPKRASDLERGQDLVVRARRSCLTPAEEREFERVLEASATLRVARDVGRDFDEIAMMRTGDDALIAKVTDRLARRAGPPRLHPRARGLLLLAAALLGTAGAAAWWTGDRWSSGIVAGDSGVAASASPGPMVPVPGRSERAEVVDRARGTGAKSAGDLRAEESTATPPPDGHSAPKNGNGGPARAPSKGDAADLFRAAGQARGAGDFGRAMRLYAQLQQRFPGSAEAQASRVSLGKLLLASGRAAAADQQFSAYLARGGALAAEALVGRAACLAALGRTTEERGVWQRIRRDYPSSVYAARAAQRLQELDSPPSAR